MLQVEYGEEEKEITERENHESGIVTALGLCPFLKAETCKDA